jgi:hypothetical protein
MRLGQLSRKINAKTSEIISFIEKDFNDTIEDHPNTKVPDIYIARIEQFFLLQQSEIIEEVKDSTSPKDKQDELQTDVLKEHEALESPEESVTEQIIEAPNQAHNDQNTLNEDEAGDDEADDENHLIIEDGVIKAPKPKFEGVKVVGKIDLPEPKETEPKETEAVDEENQDASTDNISTAQTKRRKNKPKNRNDKRKGTNRKPVVSFEEQKKKEQEAYIKQQELKKKKEKEHKRKNYESMMKEKKQTKKSVSKKNSKKKNKSVTSTEQKKQPTTIFGKFLRWLNT